MIRIKVAIRWTVLVFALLLNTSASAQDKATVLWYTEQEAGTEPVQSRYIVTGAFMRIDEGDDKGDFMLFDRKQQQIYSVVHDTRTILHIDGKGTAAQKPKDLVIEVKQTLDDKAPKVGGQTPRNLELIADGTLCYSAVVVPEVLPDARAAFQEFVQALAVQQVRTLQATPREFQTPCFLAFYIYAGDFHLHHGVPLAEWDGEGRQRQLLRYEEDVEVDPGLFVLPEDLEIYKVSQ